MGSRWRCASDGWVCRTWTRRQEWDGGSCSADVGIVGGLRDDAVVRGGVRYADIDGGEKRHYNLESMLFVKTYN